MVQKHPIFPEMVRKVPKQFSWVDHRLVRDHYIERFSHQAAALYLFLITVADARGLSYYSDSTLSKSLGMDHVALGRARHELIQLELIAWKKPIYQVLPIKKTLQVSSKKTPGQPKDQLLSIGEIFKQIAEGNHHDRL